MNRNHVLVPSDYSLIYTCVVKYQSVLLDRRRTRSIHHLVHTSEATNAADRAAHRLSRSHSSRFEQSPDCACSAIHYSSGLNDNLDKYQLIDRLTNQHRFHKPTNQKLNPNSSSHTNQSSTSSGSEQVPNPQILVYSPNRHSPPKTASTSHLNSKLKSNTCTNTGSRLSSAATGGHRMPNSNSFKNATQHTSSTNKFNENVQQGVGVNQQPASTNQAKAQPTRITDQDAIQLLAEDVESRLEALLRTFIQEEKLRQEARYNSLMGKRSASLSALNSDYNSDQDALNVDYSPIARSAYGTQQSTKHNSVTNKANLGYVKPQQHRMQQSYQLHNSQNVNTPQQQKPTAIKVASSHRLDSSSPSRSSAQNNAANNSKVNTSRTRSPSPTGRSVAQITSNIMPVNRNNLFGQHTRSDQTVGQSKSPSPSSTNKPITTNYLNLHQRSHSPSSKDAPQTLKNHQSQSSQLAKQHQMASNNSLMNNQFLGHSSHHRLYSPNHRLYDPFSGNSSQFGRSKDDSMIRRVVVYNLNKEAASVEKKPVVIESSKSMNGTLNSNFSTRTNEAAAAAADKIGTNLNDNQAIRLRSSSAKTRANSPSRVGMMNGTAIGNIGQQQKTIQKQTSSTSTGRLTTANSPANTVSKSSSSNNSSVVSNSATTTAAAKKLSSTTGSKVITGPTANRLTTGGHENSSSLQLKDQNNNLDHSANRSTSNVGGSGSAAQQLSTERKVVRKVIVKELDGPNTRSESAVNSSLNKPTYQQRLSPILNGDLTSAPKMATLNTQQQPVSTSNSQSVSSLDALLSERDRILNNRDQYKQLRNNVLSSASSDANNNYILSKNNNKNDLTSSLSSSTNSSAAGLLSSQSTNRSLPLSSSSNSVSAKRKPLIDRYSPFSIVHEARQRFEETVHKNGMNGQVPSSRFDLDSLDNDPNDDLIFSELYEQSDDEEIADSSMVLIRSRLSSMLSTNATASDLPNSTIISLLNHLSNNNNRKKEHEPLPLPACLSELNNCDLNKSQNASFNDRAASLNSPQLDSPDLPSPITAINSMRPPLLLTSPSDCMPILFFELSPLL